MERKEFIKEICFFASKKAQELGFSNVKKGSDRQKGVWGEKFTEFLEREYKGDCSSEMVFYGDDEQTFVGTRFRFASPCVYYRWYIDDEECLVEFEFTNKKYIDSGEVYERDSFCFKKGDKKKVAIETEWRIAQVTMFGVRYSDEVYRNWYKELTEILDKTIRIE